MNIYQKLQRAREIIKESDIKKDGHNDYSNYDYFTPSIVSQIITPPCKELGLITIFSLLKDDNGLFGRLIIQDIEELKELLIFEMRTEMPTLKATNVAQQMGGCDTYTRRYLLMNAFDINDNKADPDSQDNRPNNEVAKPEEIREQEAHIMKDIMSCENLADLGLLWEALSLEQKGKYETIKDNQKEKLTTKNK